MNGGVAAPARLRPDGGNADPGGASMRREDVFSGANGATKKMRSIFGKVRFLISIAFVMAANCAPVRAQCMPALFVGVGARRGGVS